MPAAAKDEASFQPRSRAWRLWEAAATSRRRTIAVVCAFLSAVAVSYGALRALCGHADEPFHGMGYHWREAELAIQADDLARAREHLRHCLEICPASAETHFLLA